MSWRYDYSGIYKIENLINGKIYIGQSKQIRQRWSEHKKELRRNKHTNEYLQRAWNKYGEENFKHEVLEFCSEDQLDERECYYIDLYDAMNPQFGYNLTSGGGRRKQYSESTREKLRNNATGSNNPNSKRVVCLENREIYESIGIAARECNTSPEIIYRCCTSRNNTAGGLHWMYLPDYEKSSEEDIINILSKPGKTKKVIYLNTLEVFPSMKEASEATNVNANSISSCCLHNRKSAGKTNDGEPRIFMYYDEYKLNEKTS